MDAKRFFNGRIILWGMLVLCLSGCQTVQVPDVNQEGFEVLDDEQRLFNRTAELNQKIDVSGIIFGDEELQDYLTGIARSLLPDGFKVEHIDLEVRVINDPIINAYAMPTGRIYLNTSMLALMDNEAQLAAVLAHEMVHILDRHALKVKRSTANKAAFFNSVAILGPIAGLGHISSILGYSQHLEEVADQEGFDSLIEHRYDPREAVKLFSRVKQFIEDEDLNTPLFFSSHPKTSARIVNFDKLLKENEQTISPSGLIKTNIFRSKTQRVRLTAIGQWIDAGMYATALAIADHYLTLNPNDKQAHYMRASIYRQRHTDPKSKKGKDPKNTEDYQVALLAYEKAIALDPQFAQAWLEKGLVLKRLDRQAEAQTAFKQSLTINPTAVYRPYIKDMLHEK